MIWFGFSNLIKKEDKRRGEFREVAEFALHVQCVWRLTDIEKGIVGSADKYISSSEIVDCDNLDWDVQGANRCDEQLKNMFSNLSTKLVIEEVVAEKFGGIKVLLSGDTEHLIMTDKGLDWQ